MNKPIAPKGEVCPLHRKDVSKVCHKCPLYIQVRGRNPNTGQEVDEWNCSLAWMPMLLIENSQQQMQTGAAVESFRNEMVKANNVSHQIMLAQNPEALINAEYQLIEDNTNE